MNTSLAIPEHVRVLAGAGGGAVLLDQRSGRCYAMNGVARELWQEWERLGDLHDALASLAARRPPPARESYLADCRAWADVLLSRGLAADRPPVVGEPSERPVLPLAKPCSAWSLWLCSILVFPVVLVLIRLPFRCTVGFLGVLRRSWCRRAVTPDDRQAATRAFDAIARFHPGRLACLEVSLGAVLAMALTRRQLALVIGVADSPYRFHAWVDSGDQPTRHLSDEDIREFRPITVL